MKFRFLKTFLMCLILALSACKSGKEKNSDNTDLATPTKQAPESQNSPSPTPSTLAPEKQIFFNSLGLPKAQLKLEVIYRIDEQKETYQEWVLVDNRGTLSASKFSFNYNQSTSNLEDHFKKRFNTKIQVEDFEKIKKSFLNSPDYKVKEKKFTACDELWDKEYEERKMDIEVSFQTCRSSKFYDIAYDYALEFHKQDRIIAYKNLFGIMKVRPKINTFLELDQKGEKFISIGTALNPEEPLSEYFKPEKETHNYCQGEIFVNPYSYINNKKVNFIGVREEPLTPLHKYFSYSCSQTLDGREQKTKELILREYPSTSEDFLDEAYTYITWYGGYIASVDKYASETLDELITKWPSVILDTPSQEEIFRTWIKLSFANDNTLYRLGYSNIIDPQSAFRVFEKKYKLKKGIYGEKTPSNSQDIDLTSLKKVEESIKTSFKELK